MDLIGTGRDADVFAIAPGRVLRRSRKGASYEHEARIMTWAHQHGIPVPEVYQSSGSDLVMERLDGPTLLAQVLRKPWTLWSTGVELARLHRLLDALPVPEWMSLTPGDGVVHLDLHPDNVMLHDGRPYLIDWTNARAAPRGEDVATSWIILKALGLPDGRVQRGLQLFARWVILRAMLRNVDRKAAVAALPAALRRRLDDRNNLPAEKAALESWLAKIT